MEDKLDKRTLRRKPGFGQANYRLPFTLIDRVRKCAYWERKNQSKVVREALESHLIDRNTEDIPEGE